METSLNDGVDLPVLIHRGGVLFDIEGNTPQEIYKIISDKIEKPEGVTSEQIYSALCALSLDEDAPWKLSVQPPTPLKVVDTIGVCDRL